MQAKTKGLFMSLFDAIKNQALSALGNSNPEMMKSITSMIDQNGGVNGLIEKFQKNGMGEQVQSWIGTGQNLPISASQLAQVFDNQTVQNFATKLGIDPNTAMTMVAQFLPQIIDKLSPNGNLPKEGNSNAITDILGKLLN